MDIYVLNLLINIFSPGENVPATSALFEPYLLVSSAAYCNFSICSGQKLVGFRKKYLNIASATVKSIYF